MSQSAAWCQQLTILDGLLAVIHFHTFTKPRITTPCNTENRTLNNTAHLVAKHLKKHMILKFIASL